MSDNDQKPTTISLVPSTVLFFVLTAITLIITFGSMFYNANGNTF